MSAEYSVKPKAVRDLDDYADYFAEQAHLEVVFRFFEAAHRTFALLATQPDMGWRSRSGGLALKSLRVFRVTDFKDMLILYRPVPGGVDILRVVSGSRNIRALLRREGVE